MTRIASIATSAFTALAIAIAPVPASAAPDGDDVARALAGLAVLGIIAKAASDKDKRRNQSTSRNDTYYGTVDNRRSRVIDGTIRPYGEPVRAKGKRKFKKAKLPDRCLRIIETRRKDRLVYGNRCLQRHYKFASRLPERCERFVRTHRGLRTVYGARCLARDGWKVARR